MKNNDSTKYNPNNNTFRARTQRGAFVISLDFELAWGFHDNNMATTTYKQNIDGAREAVKKLLELFDRYSIHATWATVGALNCTDKAQLLELLPEDIVYTEKKHSIKEFARNIKGYNEKDAETYFAPSLIKLIRENASQSIGSHTFSHFYCMENTTPENAFEMDLAASKKALSNPTSLIFPKNQYIKSYIDAMRRCGITNFRGDQRNHFQINIYSSIVTSRTGKIYRLLRIIDYIFPLTGFYDYSFDEVYENGLCNIKASSFFQPYRGNKLLDALKQNRIKSGMKRAAKKGNIFHLWWHPHNCGKDSSKNISQIEDLLIYYRLLSEKYQMTTLNMDELAKVVFDLKS